MKNTCRGRAAAEDSERETGWSDGERWRERADVAAKAGNEGEKRVSQMREGSQNTQLECYSRGVNR